MSLTKYLPSTFIGLMALAFWLGSPLVERVHSSQSEIAVSADDFFDISFGDLQEELQLVREEGKSALLVMFEMEDCPWCERMKAQVLNRVQVQDYFHENFRIISVDVEGDVPVVDFSGVEMASKDFALNILRVRATPVFVFFDHSGEIITRYTGAVKSPHDFLLLGKFVVEEHFKTKRFNKYRRENQSG